MARKSEIGLEGKWIPFRRGEWIDEVAEATTGAIAGAGAVAVAVES